MILFCSGLLDHSYFVTIQKKTTTPILRPKLVESFSYAQGQWAAKTADI